MVEGGATENPVREAEGPERGRSATSHDVARRAGVSQSTVSLVFRGAARGRVSAATQEAVHAAARELGFRPNINARRLRQGAPPTVLIGVPEITQPFFAQVFTGARGAALAAGCRVVLSMHPDLDSVAEDVVGQGVDAVLACALGDGGQPPDAAVPLVVLDAEPPPGFPSVRFDVPPLLTELATELHTLGHRTIAHLAADVPTESFRERAETWRAVCARLGIRLLSRTAPIERSGARDAALSLLEGTPRPTAVVCDDDQMAAGVYKAAYATGLRVPEDISVAGIDDVDLASALTPELTTIALPAEALGEQGMRRLIAVLDGSRPLAPDVLRLSGRLVRRGSVGSAPR
ncbi:LacI family DNA-binding transcriptional regulator [Spiractinospora alimapuensis]|uniref:LacI family DNA-binding transcriptional regulator n=1 Tax=Spiractinospora alimapuensis TaxID=2820884 RepID=UPI001F242439|nr:LacI family DNA-binding transcriptional regulator [Spiractinospora alimapuensis]QVQ52984.1 LacI family DNA-binding transcriptional regulator [Spiractinospora alimapuensis]